MVSATDLMRQQLAELMGSAAGEQTFFHQSCIKNTPPPPPPPSFSYLLNAYVSPKAVELKNWQLFLNAKLVLEQKIKIYNDLP